MALGDLELVTHAFGGPFRQHISGCLELQWVSRNASGIADALFTCLWVSSVHPEVLQSGQRLEIGRRGVD